MRTSFPPAFAAWIFTWAVTTFASAAVQAGPVAGGIERWAGTVFQIADAVPPFAKIAYGIGVALLLFTLGRFTSRGVAGPVGLIAGAPVLFVGVLSVRPLAYYVPIPDSLAGHALAALLGGAVGAFALVRGRRQRGDR